MQDERLTRAIALLEEVAADVDPDLISVPEARDYLGAYDKAQRVVSFGVATMSRRIDDAAQVAKVTGTSMGKAKSTVETGKALAEAAPVAEALASGDISFDQAGEIARAERARPGSAGELLETAATGSFQVLREKARKVVLEAERHRGLGERQRKARSARVHNDELGMVNIHLRFQPHVGTPIVNRAEAEAQRRYRAAKSDAREPFESYLADAYAAMLSGSSVQGRAKRPDVVILVSYEVAKRGWKDVREGEFCEIPGVGPVTPEVAREIAEDAFLNGVFFDGKDLRHFARWARDIPIEVRIALELGEPPEFDGVKCCECGNRFRPERDHLEPHTAGGPCSTGNLKWKCKTCHDAKTARDRRSGKLKPRGANAPTNAKKDRRPKRDGKKKRGRARDDLQERKMG